SPDALGYRYVEVQIDREKRLATWTVKAPEAPTPADVADVLAQGDAWWPLQLARELDEAILHMRTNELDIGTEVCKAQGEPARVVESDAFMEQSAEHGRVRETLGLLRRTLARLDVTSRSLFALIDNDSCFVGTLFEVALACDRSYLLDDPDADK